METIKGPGNMEISRIAAGCMRAVEAGMDGTAIRRFVYRALDLGITTFDHAPVYGAGACERFFGEEVLAKEPGLRSKMQIVTKAGIILPRQKGNEHIYYDSTKENLLSEIDASLQRLHTDHVDLLLIHRPDILGDPRVAAAALDEIVDGGKALHVGVSNYNPSQFESLSAYMTHPLAVNQVELSVKTTENFFNGTIDIAQRKGTVLMAWSPLGGGSVFRGEDEQSVRLRRILQSLAEKYDTGIDTVMYAWLLRHPAGIVPVIGTMNDARLNSAAASLNLRLSYDEWYAILAASRGFDVP